MSIAIIPANYEGGSDSSGWSGCFVSENRVLESGEKSSLFAVISSSRPDENGDKEISDSVFKKLDHYVSKQKDVSLETFKKAIEKLIDEANIPDETEIITALFCGSKVFIVAFGRSRAVIGRNRRIFEVLKGEKGGTFSVSGALSDEDIFILGTSAFFGRFSDGEIKKFASDGPQLSVETVDSKMQGSVRGRLAFIILRIAGTTTASLSSNDATEAVRTGEIPSYKINKPGRSGLSAIARFKSSLEKFPARLRERKIYIKEDVKLTEPVNRRKKVSATVGLILLVLLFVSIVFGFRRSKQEEFISKYKSRLEEAEHKLKEAEEIFSISPARSRELFFESEEILSALSNEEYDDDSIQKLTARLDESRGKILGEFTVPADLYVDLSLLSDGFEGNEIAVVDNELFIIDINSEKIASIAVDSKRSEIVVGPSQIDNAYAIAGYSDKIFLAENEGIYEVGTERKRVIDKGWEGDVMMAAFAGNLYLLDKHSSSINRYAGIQEGFSSKRNWLAEGVDVDFKNASDFVIDGSIWVLDGNKRIMKFNLGNHLNFEVGEVYPDAGEIYRIYTNDELEYLYLLDRENKRIVSVTKEGDYVAQYFVDEIAETRDFYVSEESKQAILLNGEKMFSFEMGK